MKPRSAPLRFFLLVACFCLLGLPLAAAPEMGEFGGDLTLLRRSYVAPRSQHESNHYFDLFGGPKVYQALLNNGLTNNRALIVLSHGKAITRNWRLRYAYYPDERIWPSKPIPMFSAADLARVIGPEAACEIHNVMIAGCNKEDVFDPRELRRHFVNATNITHTPPGKDGYELVFRDTLVHHSSGIRLLYPNHSKLGRPLGAQKPRFVPYVAELYRPKESKAYAKQIAGRELLNPSVLQSAPAERKITPPNSTARTTSSDVIRWR